MCSASSRSASLLFLAACIRLLWAIEYTAMQNEESNEFGLKDPKGVTCLRLKFSAKLYNFNLNGSNIAVDVPSLSSKKVNLSGQCALNDSKKSNAELVATWKERGRTKKLSFSFDTAVVKTLIKQVEQLLWQLKSVKYTETYNKQKAEFVSSEVKLSAPLRQRFVCRDAINITLKSEQFRECILELLPDINAQPYNAGAGQANLYVCERTRRRTLTESFQNHMTMLSGGVLGVSSVSVIVGYSLRRQLNPSRRQYYQSFS